MKFEKLIFKKQNRFSFNINKDFDFLHFDHLF